MNIKTKAICYACLFLVGTLLIGTGLFIDRKETKSDELIIEENNTLGTNISEESKIALKININSATKGELETLPDIGPARAQNIIDQRPYSDISELKIKKVITNNVYEKIKDLISI